MRDDRVRRAASGGSGGGTAGDRRGGNKPGDRRGGGKPGDRRGVGKRRRRDGGGSRGDRDRGTERERRDRGTERERRDRGTERERRDRPGERSSPLGPWRPSRTTNPFGPEPRRRRPRDPFASPAPDADTAEGEKKRQRKSRRREDRHPPLDLRLEVAREGTVAHFPQLPGCTFRAGDPVQLLRVAPEHVVEYIQWCVDERIADLNITVSALARLVQDGHAGRIRVAEAERRDGAALWLTGQPAALFRCDYRALTDTEVAEHFRFMRAVARRIRMRLASLTPAQLAWKPTADRRSLDETMRHLSHMVWWFCSRLDDVLPEPPPAVDPDLSLLLGERLEVAERFLLAISYEDRKATHLPRRMAAADSEERWTHTKVCRRQAEHLWEHLAGVPRAVRSAAEA
jgi:hypothetical protein